jgi:hypothetical protein
MDIFYALFNKAILYTTPFIVIDKNLEVDTPAVVASNVFPVKIKPPPEPAVPFFVNSVIVPPVPLLLESMVILPVPDVELFLSISNARLVR